MTMTAAERAAKRKAIRDARSPEEKAARAAAKKERREARKQDEQATRPKPKVNADGMVTFACPTCKRTQEVITANCEVVCPKSNHSDRKPRKMEVQS